MRCHGYQIRYVGDDDADCDLDWSIINMALEALYQSSDYQANGDSSQRQIAQPSQRLADRRRLRAQDHSQAELQREQTAGIVDQAFAFQDVDDASRQSQSA